MARLRVREVAEAQGINLSKLQRSADVAMRTARRYWYNTQTGNVEGKALEEISLPVLKRMAAVLKVKIAELIEDDAQSRKTPPVAQASVLRPRQKVSMHDMFTPGATIVPDV